MSSVTSYSTNHSDLIHDISFDFYSDRFATCSGDHSVKIWDKINGEWVCTASWKAHGGSVWRVRWAHPEFGQVIATCSLDRTAAVFEELAGDAPTAGGGSKSASSGSGDSQLNRAWVKRYNFVDSRTSVTDIKFAPKHMGLQLATCSSEGIIRIYEAPDVMDLTQWLLQHEIQCKSSFSSLSWSSAIFGQPLIVVGSNDSSSPQAGKVMLFELSEATRKWLKVETISYVTEPVHDVAFAPHMGRSFHLLAIASKDVSIITVKPLRKDVAAIQNGTTKFELRLAAQFDDHKSTVWRVNWNITGTTLTSCGDDGYIRLWRANNLGGWKLIGILKGDGTIPAKDRLMQNPAAIPSSLSSDDDVSPRAAHLQTKRSSGWPYFTTDKDKSRTYY